MEHHHMQHCGRTPEDHCLGGLTLGDCDTPGDKLHLLAALCSLRPPRDQEAADISLSPPGGQTGRALQLDPQGDALKVPPRTLGTN